MEQSVRVKRLLPDGMAEVIRVRESACSGDCHKCSGCGAAQQNLLLTARNPIGIHISQLRDKITEFGGGDVIVTVLGIGYRFDAK